jgi:S-adenosylmethionine synthetase
MMFGYATDETPSLMPLPIDLAHRMARRLAEVRHTGQIPYLRPDGKTQITVGYEDGVAKAVTAVVLSTQHREDVDLPSVLRPEIEEQVIRPLLPGNVDLSDLRIFINPTGRFEVGGPVADAGLTGRKIIVDTYGGMARHGGGAFSGKDPSKVDRSAAYATRWVAKHIVAAGLARKAELQVAYAIGVASPVSLNVETFGTETVDPDRILEGVREVFDLRPAAIIDALELRRPGYRATAAYGHFGRDGERFTWERLDRVEALRAAVGA